MKKFSTRLISLRKERGETQNDLAKVINKKRSTVSGYETEGKEPDLETVAILAQHFGVTTDYMLGMTNNRTHAETVFFNDNVNFKKLFDDLTPELCQVLAQTFDSFYLLLSRDMKTSNSEHLRLYQKLLFELQSSRSTLRKYFAKNDSNLFDPAAISNLMSTQNDLKENISSILDQLLQADLETAVNSKLDGSGVSLKELAT